MAGLQALPIDIHIMITKLLNLKECLIYSQVSRVTFDAAYYVFAHRKQLDFGSVLGPDETVYPIVCSLRLCMHTLEPSFAELEGYM